MKTFALLALAALAAVLFSFFQWKHLLGPDPWGPVPPGLTAMEWTYGREMTSLEDLELVRQLERPAPNLTLDGTAFTDAVDVLRDVSDANIFVNWRAIEAAGVSRNVPVTARMRNVRFITAVRVILDHAGGDTAALGFMIDEGVITISTDEDLAGNTMTRVYDVRDLIVQSPAFQAPDFNLQIKSSAARSTDGGITLRDVRAFFGRVFGARPWWGTASREELTEELIIHLQQTVEPDTWRDNGGSEGSIRELSGQLIVTQSPLNQRRVVYELDRLRWREGVRLLLRNAATVAAPVVLLAGGLRLLALRRRGRRAARLAARECVRCGYDLRATPDRCPECGEPVGLKGAGA